MKKLPLLLLFMLVSFFIHAQNVILPTGGEASGSGGTVSYSVGQVSYAIHTGTGGSVSEGVQQPYETYEETSIEEAFGIELLVSAYPNPTRDVLTLKVESYEIENLWYYLYDMNARLIDSKKITDIETAINMANLLPSIYFLKVIEGKKEVKTFKIVKN
ncbi:MAG: T9SS type A sorting domain-containing protein [Bacteroidetes bacterium]|nr:T9SS type A sorting domain-containing protein [Bacteroidota bacterium]